ncbi:hypothetical protein ACFVW8_15330 [Streptomyces sp. NPDC058221]|uniref:hypothetical protein n=1 Tax=Streptomyces sp. NPDC058221 TaxID=3346388 RepID=UPI0036E177D3
MNIPAGVPRRCVTLAAAGVLVIVSAAGAGAATAHGRTVPSGNSIRADQPRGSAVASPLAYRGVQGGNLCLLSRCSVGDSTPGGNAGPSNTQGFNLCLLALCTVRP